MLIGFVLDTILYGVVVTQSLVYFSCYKRYARSGLLVDTSGICNIYFFHYSDGRWLKFFVRPISRG